MRVCVCVCAHVCFRFLIGQLDCSELVPNKTPYIANGLTRLSVCVCVCVCVLENTDVLRRQKVIA